MSEVYETSVICRWSHAISLLVTDNTQETICKKNTNSNILVALLCSWIHCSLGLFTTDDTTWRCWKRTDLRILTFIYVTTWNFTLQGLYQWDLSKTNIIRGYIKYPSVRIPST